MPVDTTSVEEIISNLSRIAGEVGNVNGRDIVDNIIFGEHKDTLKNIQNDYLSTFYTMAPNFKNLFIKIQSKIKDTNEQIDQLDSEINKKINSIKTDASNSVNKSDNVFNKSNNINSILGKFNTIQPADKEQQGFGEHGVEINFSKDVKSFLENLFLNKFEKAFNEKVHFKLSTDNNIKNTNNYNRGIIPNLSYSDIFNMLKGAGLLLAENAPLLLAIKGIADTFTVPLASFSKNLVSQIWGKDNWLYNYLNVSDKNYEKLNAVQKENEILKSKYEILIGAKLGEKFVDSKNAVKAFNAGKLAEETLPEANLLNKGISKVPGLRWLYSRTTGQDIRPETMEASKALQNEKAQKALAVEAEKATAEAKIAREAAARGISPKAVNFFKQADVVMIDKQIIELGQASEALQKTTSLSVKGLEETSNISKLLAMNSKALEYASKAPLLGTILKNGPLKYIFKKIPFLTGLLGISMGAKQLQDGDTAGGIMTIISGLVGMFPGYGTVASIIIDGINWFLHHEGVIGTPEEINAHKLQEEEYRNKQADIFRAAGISEDMVQKYLAGGAAPQIDKNTNTKRNVYDTPEQKKKKEAQDQAIANQETINDFSPVNDAYIKPMPNRKLILNGKPYNINNDDTVTMMPKGGINAEFKLLRESIISMHKDVVQTLAKNQQPNNNNNISNINVSSQSNSSGSSNSRDANWATRSEWWRFTTPRGAIV